MSQSLSPDFVAVAAVEDIADGKAKSVTLNDKEIALFRIGDEFYAIDNACPHYGSQLCEGVVRDATVACPWHGWRFDLKTGKGLTVTGRDVQSYAVKVEAGQVKIAAL